MYVCMFECMDCLRQSAGSILYGTVGMTGMTLFPTAIYAACWYKSRRSLSKLNVYIPKSAGYIYDSASVSKLAFDLCGSFGGELVLLLI